MPQIIRACLAILQRETGDKTQILLAKRPVGKILAGYWEFPGGKIETGESPEQALKRELDEELGISVSSSELVNLGQIEHNYAHGLAKLDIIAVNTWQGVISGREGQELCWQPLNQVNHLSPLLPTTARIITLLNSINRGRD